MTGTIQGMKLMPDDLPDGPVLLKQMLLEAQGA